MALISIIKTYNPTIKVDDVTAEFDAEIDMSILTRVNVTKYPIETGQELAGSLILIPSEIHLVWGVGVRKITGLLSEEPLAALEENATSLLAGFASNAMGELGSFVMGLISNIPIVSTDKTSRAFKAMAIMQKAQISGIMLTITLEGVGIMHNMLVTEVKVSRKGTGGGVIIFDISMMQPIISSDKLTQDQFIINRQMGEVKGIDIDDNI